MNLRLSTIVLLVSLIFAECSQPQIKSYSYVEVVADQSLSGSIENKEKEPKEIKADSDTAAYLQAYQNFCISLKVCKDMKQSLGTVFTTPLKFKLLDDKGKDITGIDFADRPKREKEIEKLIFSMDNSIQQSMDKNHAEKVNDFKAAAVIDSVKAKELSKYFRQKKDEFAKGNTIWYEPKSAPQYANRNGIYCYFQTVDGIPQNLRFKFQYYADEWLFFSRLQFAVDGNAFEYIPNNTETDNADGKIWEWFDQPITEADKELITALANAKSAKVKLIGRQYYDTKNLSKEQITSIKQTIDLYTALGGKF